MSVPSHSKPADDVDRPVVASRLLIVATEWDHELRGANYAIVRARQIGQITVDVVYAAAPIVAWQVLRFWTRTRAITWQHEKGERVLRAYRDKLGRAGVAPTCHVCIEDPAKAITKLAFEIDAECVVIPMPPRTELPPFGYWGGLHRIIRQSEKPIVLS